MLLRRIKKSIMEALSRQAAVALLGPRQVGKTTLALEVGAELNGIYLDLEDPSDRAKLEDPKLFFEQHPGRLIVLDEVHRLPGLFQILRGVIDRERRQGKRTGRFLLLGSAGMELLRQSGESLAGRIAYVPMLPIDALEHGGGIEKLNLLWLRGGFPDSLLASSDEVSFALRRDFIRTYLERDVPLFGPRIPAETLGRLWTMLANGQGTMLNASRLAANLSISAQTCTRYIDLLADLLLARRLPPFHINLDKRLVKSPKVYVRDSGLLHALLGLGALDQLMGHPVVGGSWEGFVIENLLAAAPERAQASFFRTAAGAEIDLIIEFPEGERWAIEIKLGHAPKLARGFHQALEDIQPDRAFVVYSGEDRYSPAEGVEAIGLTELMNDVLARG